MRRPSKRAREDALTLERSLASLPEPEERAAFVMLSGLPASGKSHVAGELARRYPLAVLQIDSLRKVLFPIPVYSSREHTRIFAAVYELIDRLLSRGISVLYDATNLKEQHRQTLYDIAEFRGARLLVVEVTSPEPVILARLRERVARGAEAWASDADETVYEVMRLDAEQIDRPHIKVDASGDIRAAVDKIVNDLRGDTA